MEVWEISTIHLRKKAQTYSNTNIWSFLKDRNGMKIIILKHKIFKLAERDKWGQEAVFVTIWRFWFPEVKTTSPKRLTQSPHPSHFSISVIHLLGMLCFKDTTWCLFNTYLAMGYLLLSVVFRRVSLFSLSTIIQLLMYNLQ